ncbi:MAG: probable monooxygenase [Leptospirillum rubarum]|nr:MAG: probable monooxygenase [Leptospirillum rubarum]
MSGGPVDTADVVIAGAGAGGLTLATILGRAGVRVLVVDPRPAILPVGRGELVQPLGLDVLSDLGLLESLLALPHVRNASFDFLDGQGRILMRSRYDQGGGRFPFAISLEPHRMDQMLLEGISRYPSVQVRFGSGYVDHRVIPEGVDVFWTEQGEPRRTRAVVLVGDDGRRSRVREKAGIAGVVRPYRDSYLSWSFDCPSDAPDSVSSTQGRYFIAPGKIFFLFAVSPVRRFFLYMLSGGDRQPLEKKGLEGFFQELDGWIPGLASILRRTGPKTLGEIPEMTVMKVDLKQWSSGPVVLVGDAAHAMNPHVAQGRNQAMEDARTLGGLLIESLGKGPGPVIGAIGEYESRRKPRTLQLHRLADEMTWVWNSGNLFVVAVRERVFRGMDRTPVLGRKIVRTISGLDFEPLTSLDKLKAFWAG